MGKFTVIADVGQALVHLLQDSLCPDVVFSPDTVGLCSPVDKGDMVLGIHLYDIRESREVRGNEMINQGPSCQRYPSLYLTLSYMITAYSKADVKYRALENQRILGKVIQTLQDHSVLSADTLTPVNRGAGLDLHIEMLRVDMEEQRKIWNASSEAYQTSLFYQVSPVEMESTRTRKIQRVVDVGIGGKR